MQWNDQVQAVFEGDLVTILAYTTKAGGAIAIPVTPAGSVDREAGTIAVTTSLAFSAKLRHILREPRVAMAYHTREHGFASDPSYVLAQGTATVPLTPDPAAMAALEPQIEKFLGTMPSGTFWNWVLREYLEHRVIITIALDQILMWPNLNAAGPPAATQPAPDRPEPQPAPVKGTGPRVGVGKLFKQVAPLPHQVIAYRGADGYPVVLPVRVTGQDERGLHLTAAPGLLPPGGRRAGLTAHAFGPKAVGLANRVATGWLDVTGGTAVYAPHTASGFSAPPIKSLQIFANGMLAKQGLRKARRDGTLDELTRLQSAR